MCIKYVWKGCGHQEAGTFEKCPKRIEAEKRQARRARSFWSCLFPSEPAQVVCCSSGRQGFLLDGVCLSCRHAQSLARQEQQWQAPVPRAKPVAGKHRRASSLAPLPKEIKPHIDFKEFYATTNRFQIQQRYENALAHPDYAPKPAEQQLPQQYLLPQSAPPRKPLPPLPALRTALRISNSTRRRALPRLQTDFGYRLPRIPSPVSPLRTDEARHSIVSTVSPMSTVEKRNRVGLSIRRPRCPPPAHARYRRGVEAKEVERLLATTEELWQRDH